MKKRKGWVLYQEGEDPLDNEVLTVFSTKDLAWDYHGSALGDNNRVVRVEISLHKRGQE